jgi:hypothetical protein
MENEMIYNEQYTHARGMYPPQDLRWTCRWYSGSGESRGTYFIDLRDLKRSLAEMDEISE